VPIVLKSGSLNLLEPSGPVKGCNGIALPSPFTPLYALLTRYCSGNKIEKNGMGWTCRGSGETYTGFRWGNQRERDHRGDPGVDERIILRWIFRKWDM
jgi:hypothetical protein